MEIIARIPELPCIPAGDAGRPLSPERAVMPHSRPDATPSAADEPGGPPATGVAEPAARRRRPAVHRAANVFFTPSVLGLAAVAATVWTFAWRNERQRAIEQQRPQRMAMEPAASAGPGRSLTP